MNGLGETNLLVLLGSIAALFAITFFFFVRSLLENRERKLAKRLNATAMTIAHRPLAGGRMTVWKENLPKKCANRPVRCKLGLIACTINARGQPLVGLQLTLWHRSQRLAGQFEGQGGVAPCANHRT